MAEHLDVLVVGAGLSGVGAGHHLQTECPWASYAILEARDAIGGTWDLFRYPGIRSDRALRLRGIDDEAMRFTNQAVDAPPPVAAGERQGVERSITSSTSP